MDGDDRVLKVRVQPANEVQDKPEPRTFRGGVRWRKFTNVSAPLAELTVEIHGIALRPSSKRFPMLWHMLGIPTLSWEWSRIDQIELARGPYSLGWPEGVSFTAEGRRLVFGCDQATAEEIVDYARQLIPGKVIRRAKPKMVI